MGFSLSLSTPKSVHLDKSTLAFTYYEIFIDKQIVVFNLYNKSLRTLLTVKFK